MSIKLNPWKMITASIATIIAAVFSSGSSKALSVENKAISGLTVEERIAKVREQLQQNEHRITNKSDTLFPSHPDSEAKEVHVSQWNNWSDWCKYNCFRNY